MPLLPYLLFFLSGAASLVYEVAWVRSLGLVFGNSHLAVTTVLALFMGGLALGSALLGKRADAARRPLALYGMLELGVAASALLFMALMHAYGRLYAPLATLAGESRFWLSVIRVGLGAVAMIVPTTLMGGTLPVLSRFVAQRREAVGRQLSFLYGINTLGAMIGALACGFALLKTLGVTGTQLVAVGANLVVGIAALALPERLLLERGPAPDARSASAGAPQPSAAPAEAAIGDRSTRLLLWGTGISGFCALGYEILWTRVLTLVVGTSAYSFTIILVAFLAGIALGSQAFGLMQRWRPRHPDRALAGFGAVQVAIGLVACLVTVLMRYLPAHANSLQALLIGSVKSEFGIRQGASFLVAFAYVLAPALLMGLAFPLAATLVTARGRPLAGAIGSALTCNTVGAILGAAATGFVLVPAVGIERSLQLLLVLNVTIGLLVLARSAGSRRRTAGVVWLWAAALLVALVVNPRWGRFWDADYFALFQNNRRELFDTPEKRQLAREHLEVLYYFEGVNETISVVRAEGATQSFVVNGRAEASTVPGDVQVQLALGHVPMLLHPNPRRVFVLGTGTGMTLGATSIHPEVDTLVLAEIEPGVLGATRTFAEHNHRVLDDPKLRIVFNDGRNHLATTRDRFDVITADPIHPWSGGAAYLYSAQYFESVAEHLAPGGIACQWLPLYELTVRDVQTVVRTFARSFPHVMLWVTHWDSVLIGSNSPIVIDEAELARRMAHPTIAKDLRSVEMGSAEDFVSYFAAGTEGARSFGQGGMVHTDDNLFLEFSAPESVGVADLDGDNVQALASVRESVLPYLKPAAGEERERQLQRWQRNLAAARLYDQAHALFLLGDTEGPAFARLGATLERDHPRYAPYRFLRALQREEARSAPRLVSSASFPVVAPGGTHRVLVLSAVTVRNGAASASLVFVDNDRREIYGRRLVTGREHELEALVEGEARAALTRLQGAYAAAAAEARLDGRAIPAEAATGRRLKDLLANRARAEAR